MSDLLKSAIADAKAVRATALANAKAALEEAFSPRLKEMLTAKLEEDGGEDLGVPAAPEGEEEVAPEAPVDAEIPVAPEAPVVTDEVPSEEPVVADAPVDEVAPMEETVDPQGASNEVSKGAKKDDKNVTTDLSGSELKQKSTLKADTKDPQGDGKEVTAGAKKDDKNVTPDLKAESVNPNADLEEVVAELTSAVDELPAGETSDEIPLEEVEEVEVNVGGEKEPVKSADEAEGEDEEFNLEEILKELEEDGKEQCVVEDAPNIDDYNAMNAKLEEVKKENADYKKAVTEIRVQLDEVNLLNAKLLYTNKLFKSYNLSNSQKMKVVESFDLTKCVREVKLIYATLAESFNFGATSKKSFITEGLASKVVASTKPAVVKTQILAEGVEMANRFKKLAGIKAKK